MKFMEAYLAAEKGKKIRRKEFKPDSYFSFGIVDGIKTLIFLNDGSVKEACFECDQILSSEDILTEDWEILE